MNRSESQSLALCAAILFALVSFSAIVISPSESAFAAMPVLA